MERLAKGHELLDGPLDAPTLRGNLRDLARTNRLLGGVDLTWHALRPFLSASQPLSVLDVGTGSADIPRGLVRRAAGRWPLQIVATDVRLELVEAATVTAAATPPFEVRLQQDPSRIDAADDSFDVVHSSLLFHHLEPDDARQMLGEMRRVARKAVVVNDLDRGRLWWLGAWLMSHLLTANRYTRHDAPLSVRRAYRPAEISQLAEQAGLREIARHRARPPYRYALVFKAAA